MEKYLDYFNGLDKFVAKKDIVKYLKDSHDVELSTSQYSKLIKKLILDNIIAKSTKSTGKCSYISVKFLDNNKLNAIDYYKSLKVGDQKQVALAKNETITDTYISKDCIEEITEEELYEL